MSRARASLLVTLLGLGVPSPADAHPLAPSVLSFEQSGQGQVTMRWRAPVKRPTGQSLRPRVPTICKVTEPVSAVLNEEETAVTETRQLQCDPPDMTGAVVAIDGFEDSTINVVVRVVRADGTVHHAILDAGTPQLTIASPQEESHTFFEYLMLGVEHLLTGWDHLTFVIGLLILFGWQRRLVAAVTAFTVGHSLTLALSVLGLLSVPQAIVEALIAMTIVVLALEIQSGRHGPVWKHPWTLPGALGLLHGLGFASVLFDAGLPSDEIPLALFGFNLGLELGQLGVIAIAWASYAVVRSAIPAGWQGNRTLPAYVIGSLAAFWVIERTLSVFGLSV
ncbi:MAG: HupE/UreJ family protein [Polyangiales bacterium]